MRLNAADTAMRVSATPSVRQDSTESRFLWAIARNDTADVS